MSTTTSREAAAPRAGAARTRRVLIVSYYFPPVLVMEYVRGEEHTVDGICRNGRLVLGHAKTREAVRAGLAMFFATVDAPELVEASRALVADTGLEWFVNVQFLGDRLLEVNPRISTIVYQEDLNLPWIAVRVALGTMSPEEAAALAPRTRIGRRVTRLYEQVEVDP